MKLILRYTIKYLVILLVMPVSLASGSMTADIAAGVIKYTNSRLPANGGRVLGESDVADQGNALRGIRLSSAEVQAQGVADATDTDGDGLSDYEERAIYQTFWYDSDTDNDGFSDYDEVQAGYSPKQPGQTMKDADTDNDGLNDAWEIALGTNLMVRDTDGDGFLDGTEVYEGFSPTTTELVRLTKEIFVNDKELNLKFYIAGQEVLDIPVSTGKPSTPTPHGEFEILDKVPVKHYGGPGYDYPNTLWNMHFTTDYWRYYIHGAYWHDNFGIRPVSGGCVNVRYEDMEDLYNFTEIGTRVVIN